MGERAKSLREKFKINRPLMLLTMNKSFVTINLDVLKEYVFHLEMSFKSDLNQISKRYEEKVKGIENKELIEQLSEFYGEEHHMIDVYYLRIFRYSSLMAIHSFFENSMYDVAILFKTQLKIEKPLREFPGQGIEKYKRFLKKEARINFPDTTKEWNFISDFLKIRNCIVHCDGKVYMSSKFEELAKIVDKDPDLALRHERELTIEKNYLDRLVESMEKFFEDLFKKSRIRIEELISEKEKGENG